MDDAELRRHFGELHTKLDTAVQLQRRTLQEQQRMTQIQQTILDAMDRADTQLKADKVVITTQSATIASQAQIITGLKGQVADLTAKLGQQNVNLDDEVDPDSIHSRLATLDTTIGDLAGVTTSATGFDFQSGAAMTSSPPAIGDSSGTQVGSGQAAPGATTLKNPDGSEVQGIPAAQPGQAPGTIAPNPDGTPNPTLVPDSTAGNVVGQAPAPGAETTAAAPGTSIAAGTTAGPAAVAGVDKPGLVDQVVTATNASSVQVSAAVDAHVAVTDGGGTLDQAAGAAADAAVAHGAGVETGANIAAAIVAATAPAAGQPDAVAQAGTVTVPVPDPAKPAGLPDNSVASGSASAASTIGAAPSPDVAALTGVASPAVTVEGAASGVDPAAVTQVPASPAPAAPNGGSQSSS